MSERRISNLQIAEGYYRERLAATRADLAAAQARADGLLLVVEELRAALRDPSVPHRMSGWFGATIYFWANGVSPNDDWMPEAKALYAILAADPEARAASLLAAKEPAS